MFAFGGLALAAGQSLFFLLIVVVEDDTHVLAAAGALAGAGLAPERLQQLLERGLFRIVIDLERLAVVADVLVGRVFLAAARVADTGADDAGQTPKLGVRRPESAQSERGRFQFGWRGRVNRRLGLVALGRFVIPVQGKQERRGQDGNGVKQSLHGNLQSYPHVAQQLYLGGVPTQSQIRNPKSEIRKASVQSYRTLHFGDSEVRISDFGFRISHLA